MPSDEGNENYEKNNNRSNQQISNFARAAHSYFCNVRLPKAFQLHVLWRKCRTCSIIFFTHFYFGGRQHFSFPLQNFHVVLQQKMSPLFFISRSSSLLLFFSMSFAGLSPTFSFSLSFSCSIFQICCHDNLSKINTLDDRDNRNKFGSAFRLRFYTPLPHFP